MVKGETYELEVKLEEAGKRLDQFLAAHPKITSRSFAGHLIEEGQVLVNKKPSLKHYRLKKEDKVSFKIFTPLKPVLEPETTALKILYEDNDLIVLSKPAGMLVHPISPNQKGTLVNALLAYHPNFKRIILEFHQGFLRPGIVHRLDKDTSGLMVVAKNLKTQKELIEKFKKREVKRGYLALVQGRFKANFLKVDVPLGKGYKKRTRVVAGGRSSKEAISYFKVKERFENYTLLEVNLETGRTHQIRAHLNYLKYPVVGDKEYGFRKAKDDLGLSRPFLHAYYLNFEHPKTGQKLESIEELPEELKKALEKLRAGEVEAVV